MGRQLALGLTIPEDVSLASFIPGPNRQVVFDLTALASGDGEPFIYLWGGQQTGKSHLLQAACVLADAQQRTAAYIPFKQAAQFTPEILEGLESLPLVCLDDIQAVAGDPAWEQALFHLFNRIRDAGGKLLLAADRSPKQLPVDLPDLASRLTWGVSYQLAELAETDKQLALIEDAARRGLEMSPDSANYILRHSARDMGSLRRLMDELDRTSLEAQRRLTIPFIKNCLAQHQQKGGSTS